MLIGWSGRSNVYLGWDKKYNQHVVLKIKPKELAIQEVRVMVYLQEVNCVPLCYGLLLLVDGKKMAVVCQHISQTESENGIVYSGVTDCLAADSKGKNANTWQLGKE